MAETAGKVARRVWSSFWREKSDNAGAPRKVSIEVWISLAGVKKWKAV